MEGIQAKTFLPKILGVQMYTHAPQLVPRLCPWRDPLPTDHWLTTGDRSGPPTFSSKQLLRACDLWQARREQLLQAPARAISGKQASTPANSLAAGLLHKIYTSTIDELMAIDCYCYASVHNSDRDT